MAAKTIEQVMLKFREAMRLRHVTIKQLAKSIGVSEKQLSKWLKGDAGIRLNNLFLIARELGLEVTLVEKGVQV
jgi:transcriptional regulator with XRE-family HTH domain